MCEYNPKENNVTDDMSITGEEIPEPTEKKFDDINEHIQEVLQQMKDKFQTMSDQILSKNDMGTRIDDLEKNILDLMNHAGVDTPDK